jgi:hypothetical protein
MLKQLAVMTALLSSTSYAAANTIYTYAIHGSVVLVDGSMPNTFYGNASGTVTVDGTTQTWLNVDFIYPGLNWHFSTPPTEYSNVDVAGHANLQMNFVADDSLGGLYVRITSNVGQWVPPTTDPVTGEITYGHTIPIEPFFAGMPAIGFTSSHDPTIRIGGFELIQTYETPAPVVGAGLPGLVLAAFWCASKRRKQYHARLSKPAGSSVTVRSAGWNFAHRRINARSPS